MTYGAAGRLGCIAVEVKQLAAAHWLGAISRWTHGHILLFSELTCFHFDAPVMPPEGGG